MHPPGASTVLVRHGEIGTKSDQVRMRMEGRLRENLAAILADRDVPGDVHVERNRLYVHTDAVEAATSAVTDGFGVVSASPARVVDPTLDAIGDALVATAEAHFAGGTFGIDARRAGETDAHPFSSRDIGEVGGRAVGEALDAAGFDPSVDLDDPDLTLSVECRPDRAFVFCETRSGPGGLPLGSQAPLVALLSGGIDSPVAAWLAMKRGARVQPIYVDLGDYGGADHRARAVATAERLAAYAPDQVDELSIAPAGDAVERIAETTHDHRMLVLRRLMLRIAAQASESAVGVVTGESIGQKSSQTTANLAAVQRAIGAPVIRPLATWDKDRVIARAREIGTYNDATIDAGCNRVAPSYPETGATPAGVDAVEPADASRMAADIADRVESIPIEPRHD
ncbi:tRNA sulfurtransferase [Halococcoides cellulosivorans]|uniref:Probable tRNA sulfurtransferase n=1 Tax=Halococcoides cellulosivorans TaxID=1679096 RepID=A0A2R4X1K3_9EURY|nr:tRNA sulfurtransferase [Halococcoides cellulosivorans]AWB27669.1 tRNA 4-thiouridine(8) synthase ThiI [Halococcoides cellulosivorans]